MDALLGLYVQTIRLLKSDDDDLDTSAIEDLLDAKQGTITAVLLRIMRAARKKFLAGYTPTSDAQLTSLVTDLVPKSWPANAVPNLVDALKPIVSGVIKLHEADGLAVSYDTANAAAIDYLTGNAKNYFTTLSDSIVAGIHSSIAQAKSEKHTLDDIAAAVRSAYGKDLTFVTDTGTRTLDNGTWALMVARTEGTRAAAAGTRATLQDLGMRTWTWVAESEACDGCASNDGETVAIGDDFPSGDSEPPAHPNCRCICLPTAAELTTLDEAA